MARRVDAPHRVSGKASASIVKRSGSGSVAYAAPSFFCRLVEEVVY